MILTRATSPGSEGFAWNYTYKQADDSKTLRDPYGLDIETVKNKFGGTTTYGFEKIEKVGSPVELYAITSKKQSNGGEWTYEYDVGTGSNDFDINTIEFPDGRIEEHIFCNQRQLTSVSGCQYLNGYLVEKNIYSAGTDISSGSPVQSEYYDWIFNVEFTNQYQTIPGSGGGATLSSTPHPIRSRVLAQRIIHRDNNFYTTSYFDFDLYGNPADIVEKNNNSRKSYPASASSITGVRKHTEYTYDNEISDSNWILGLVKSQTLNEVNDIPTDDKIVNTYFPSGDLKSSNVNGKLSSYDYDNEGNLISITLPDGHQTKYSQFVLGIPELIQQSRYQLGNFELVESREVDSRTGYINSVSDMSIDVLENGGGGTTEYEYDRSGRVDNITTPRLGSSAISIDRGTSSTKTIRGNRQVEQFYDDYGRVTSTTTTDLSGEVDSISVNYEYDELGRLTFESVPYSDNARSNYGTYSEYDVFGRVVKMYIGNSSEISSAESVTSFDYNDDTVTITDPENNITVQEYRAFGNPDDKLLVKTTQEEDVVTTIDRTYRGDIFKVTQLGLMREYKYDTNYQLERVIQPEIDDIVFTYTTNGQVKTKKIGSAPATTYSYDDGRGNLTGIVYGTSDHQGLIPNSESVSMTYYGDNNLRSVSKGDASWAYIYDPNKQLQQELLSYTGTPDANIGFFYVYDELDHLASASYPDRELVLYEPDIFGRPTKVNNATQEEPAYASEVTYHPSGQVDTITFGNGLELNTLLNDRLVPRRISLTNANRDELDFENYSYDKNFNVLSLSSSLFTGAKTFGYDGLNRLTSVTQNGQLYNYSYDVYGNIESYQDAIIGASISLEYDTQNRLSSVSALNGIEARTFSHDNHGNITSSNTDRYLFDRNNQLRRIITDSENVTMDYDGNGHRVSRVRNGVNKIFFYDINGRLMYERTPLEDSSTSYYYLGNQLIARVNTYDSVFGLDSDADGILDIAEGDDDFDDDGTEDSFDLDTDGDGILDAQEGLLDSDGDGSPDYKDFDSDNDGVLDTDERWAGQFGECLDYRFFSTSRYITFPFRPTDDLDGEGTINARDADIDGDDITNFIERQVTPDTTDIDCDGLAQWYDKDSDGDTWPDVIEGLDDFDEDGLANYLDEDSDNDGFSDQMQPPIVGDESEPRYFIYIEGEYVSNTLSRAVMSSDVYSDISVVNGKFVVSLPANVTTAMTRFQFRAKEPLLDINDPNNVNLGKCVPNSRGNNFFTSLIPITDFTDRDFEACGSVASTPAPAYEFTNSLTYEVLYSVAPPELGGRRAIFEVVRPFRVDSSLPGAIQFVGFYDDLPIGGQLADATTDTALAYSGQYSQYIPNFGYANLSSYVRPLGEGDDSGGNGGNNDALPDNRLIEPGCCLVREGIPFHVLDSDGEVVVDFNSIGERLALRFGPFFFDDRNLDDPYGLLIFGPDVDGNFGEFKWQVSNVLDVHDALGPFPSGFLLFEVQSPSTDGSIGEIRFIEQYNPPTAVVPSPAFSLFSSSDFGVFMADGSDANATLLEEQGPDSDGDGIRDLVEKVIQDYPIDTDNDGTPDYLDLDSDNDGLLDEYEARRNYLDPPDSDGMGAPDYRDTDSDNDGIADELETLGDPDLDGLENHIDLDSDNDFIPDAVEGGQDTDSDGIPDYLDRDSDGDTIIDTIEAQGQFDAPADTDGDGIPDYLDTDSDNDGVADTAEAASSLDTDNDGLPDTYEIANGLDPNVNDASLDSDGDGLSNAIEFSLGTNPVQSDSDGDGVPDGVEIDFGSDALNTDSASDTDGDGISNIVEYETPLTVGNVVHRINMGGLEVDTGSVVWTADSAYFSEVADADSRSYTTFSAQVVSSSFDSSIVPESVFLNGRYGSNSESAILLSVPVIPGDYEVALYFSEIDNTVNVAGQRVMNLTAENELLVQNLDLFETYGTNQAGVETLTVAADNSLDIEISAIVGTAILSGVVVTVAEPETDDPVTGEGNAATFVSVNDWYNPLWGGGFNVKYAYTLTQSDLPAGPEAIGWQLAANYTGLGTIVNAWMNSYNGGITHGYSETTQTYSITNESIDFKPTLSVGDTLEFNFQVNGAGFSEADFDPRFFSLAETSPEEPDQSSEGNTSVANVNSWYNASNGSGGYNVTFTYTFGEADLPDSSNETLIMDVTYSGAGTITTGWVGGYPGSLSVNVLSGNHIQFSNATIGYKPDIAVGDSVDFSIQVNQAPFVESEFNFAFSQ